MIEKERLEELIQQKATIYEAKYGKVKSVDLSKVKDYFMSKEYIKLKNFPTYYLTRKRYDRLFETKEEAEFALRYQNITRTETLSLPTWEEIKKYGRFTFEGKDKTKYTLYYISGFNTLSLVGYITEYYGDFTLDNYYKCCELCRKLFLGEEVE